jgi:NACalpha-BTF3-like transcription factor
MAKQDFCFTYYDGDAARDMAHMTRLERGAYSDIIISQRKFGHLPIDRIKKTLGKDFDECWSSIEIVMVKDDQEKYYIEWLENSIEKMRRQSRFQSENGKLGGRPKKDEEKKPNESQSKAKRKRKKAFRKWRWR